MKLSRIAAAIAAMAFTGGVLAPALAQTPLAAVSPALAPQRSPADQNSTALAGARASLLQFIQDDQSQPMPASQLTNRSAAVLGVALLPGLLVAESLCKLESDNQPRLKPIEREIEAFVKKYGLDRAQDEAVEDKRIEQSGREFYGEEASLLVQITKLSPDGKAPAPSSDNSALSQIPKDIDSYTLTPISPTRVKIAFKGQDPRSHLEARLEDGQWRFDFGDLAEYEQLAKEQQAEAKKAEPKYNDVPDSLFYKRAQSEDMTPIGMASLLFDDDYIWGVDDKIIVSHRITTSKGRDAQVWLGRKADYYHILNTNLVAIRVHNGSYPRQDTINDAILVGDIDRVRDLVTSTPALVNEQADLDTPLEASIAFKREDIFLFLLQHGANVNLLDKIGLTPLMSAADATGPDGLKFAQQLIDAGADVNAKDRDGDTALSFAIRKHNADIIALLKQHGAH